MKKPSKTQQILIDLAEQNPNGIFYPHYQMWHDKGHESIIMTGSGFANAIKALIRNGIAKPLPELHPYAFELIDFKKREIK